MHLTMKKLITFMQIVEYIPIFNYVLCTVLGGHMSCISNNSRKRHTERKYNYDDGG